MKELHSNFLSLLPYVPYIIDEKLKIQRFLSCFPIMSEKRIEYVNPKTLEETMRKENLCYDQNKNKRESTLPWKNERKNNFYSRKKKNKFHKQTRNNSREYQGNN